MTHIKIAKDIKCYDSNYRLQSVNAIELSVPTSACICRSLLTRADLRGKRINGPPQGEKIMGHPNLSTGAQDKVSIVYCEARIVIPTT